MSLAADIKAEARRLGFDAAGIARLPRSGPSSDRTDSSDEGSPVAAFRRRLHEWLQRGYQGTMAWLTRDPARRADPSRVLDGCRSVISLGMSYYTEHWADERPGHGRIARYAWGRDYHEVLRERLQALESFILRRCPEARTKHYVDTGPVMEKAWAQQAGLGWIGKHSNLVSPSHGSWLLLGEILTTLELDPDEAGSDLCGSCSLCIQACPTGAIPEPYVLDARRCISYLTIELRQGEAIPEALADKMGNRIFGCDDCLDACPYNHQAVPTTEPAFQPDALTLAPDLDGLSRLSEEEFLAVFRHRPLTRPRYASFLRNLRIALRHDSRTSRPAPVQVRH